MPLNSVEGLRFLNSHIVILTLTLFPLPVVIILELPHPGHGGLCLTVPSLTQTHDEGHGPVVLDHVVEQEVASEVGGRGSLHTEVAGGSHHSGSDENNSESIDFRSLFWPACSIQPNWLSSILLVVEYEVWIYDAALVLISKHEMLIVQVLITEGSQIFKHN